MHQGPLLRAGTTCGAVLVFAAFGCSSSRGEPDTVPMYACANDAACAAQGGSANSVAPDPSEGAPLGGAPGGIPTVPGNVDEGPPDVTGVGTMDPMTPATTDPPVTMDPDPVVMPESCDVGVADPNTPPQTLTLGGSLGAHDPVIIAAHDQFYYFSTGNGISAKVSPDLLEWTQQPSVFPDTPAWFQQLVPEYQPRNIWAPDIAYFGEQYHLYYSVSSFGDNRSCIGHATRAALNAGAWTDHEDVFCSNQPGQNQNFNAIDPNIIVDEAGTPWMSFGSFWSGIKMIRLDQNGDRAGDELIDMASRGGGSIEAPFIVRRCGFYYLFVSFGNCCQGADSTYNIRVGRSADVLGPYVDKAGTPMMEGGGSLVLEAGGDWVGPGHNAVLMVGTKAYNVYHAYLATNGQSRLRISEMVWDAEGWPISAGP